MTSIITYFQQSTHICLLHLMTCKMGKGTMFIVLMSAFSMYSVWVYTSGTSTAPVRMSEDAIHGQAIFRNHNCNTCHQLFGLGGYLGRELTKIKTVRGRSPEFLKGMLNAGTLQMPKYNFSETECNQLLAYFDYVDTCAGRYKE